MQPNFVFVFVAALIPLVTGFLWYHPRVLGTAWTKAVGMTPEDMQKGPKPIVFVISYVLSLLLAFALYNVTVHQNAITSLFVNMEGFNDPNSPAHQQYVALMEQLGTRHRTFGHGALHGALAGIFIAFPILATNGMFERRTWKLNLINAGYWLVTMSLMGGVVCALV